MGRITVDEQRCKGCGLCINVCPKKILKLSEDKLNDKGYSFMVCFNMDECIGCARCAMMCPDIAIEVER